MLASWPVKMDRLVGRLKAGRWNEWIGWPVWVVSCFLATMIIGGVLVAVMTAVGQGSLLNGALGNMVLSAVIYVILVLLLISIAHLRYKLVLPKHMGNVLVLVAAVAIAAVLPIIHFASVGAYILLGIATGLALVFANIPVARRKVTAKVLGVARPLTWSDIGLGAAGYVIYFLIFIALTIILSKILPGYNADQAQDLGFDALYGINRTIGFIVLVIVTPLAEELVMRGFLFGKLRESKMPFWPAAVIVSILFGLAHGQWNVAIDTFILSMAACYLREVTGAIWPGVVIHMVKNAVAYVLLFVLVVK